MDFGFGNLWVMRGIWVSHLGKGIGLRSIREPPSLNLWEVRTARRTGTRDGIPNKMFCFTQVRCEPGCKPNSRPAAAVVEITASRKPRSRPTWNHRSALIIKGPAQALVSPKTAQPRCLSKPVNDVSPVLCLKEPLKHRGKGQGADYVFSSEGKSWLGR